MAQCEKCGTTGHEMQDMSVEQETKAFVGPCCVKTIPDLFDPDLNYGVEFSSHIGLRAYVSYAGFSLEFKKTREELKKWMNQKQETQVTETSNQVEMTN